MQGELPPEREHRVRSEEPLLQGLLAGAGTRRGRAPWSWSGRARGCAATARRCPGRRGPPTPVSSRLTSSSVSRVIWSGTRSSSSRSSTGQASAAPRRAMLAWVRARSPKPWLASARLGPHLRRVAEVQRVLLVLHLEHQPDRPRDQLLLVGLDPERDPHQLRAGRRARRRGAGRSAPGAGSAKSRPAVTAEPGGGRRGSAGTGGGGRAAGHGVGHGVEQAAYERLARPRRGRRAPRPRQHHDPVAVGLVERADAPAARRRPGSNLPAATSRMPSSAAPPSRATVGCRSSRRVGLGEHRQGGPDRQRDRASGVAELDHAVARRLAGRKVAGPVTGTKLKLTSGPGRGTRR